MTDMKIRKDIIAFDLTMVSFSILGISLLYPSPNIIFPVMCGVFGVGNFISKEWIVDESKI